MDFRIYSYNLIFSIYVYIKPESEIKSTDEFWNYPKYFAFDGENFFTYWKVRKMTKKQKAGKIKRFMDEIKNGNIKPYKPL